MNNHENTAPQPIVGDAHLNVTDAPSTPATTPGAEGEPGATVNNFASGESA